MQKLFWVVVLLFLAACGPHSARQTSLAEPIDSASYILNLSKTILNTIKQEQMDELSTYFHPKEGVVFSPYAYIESLDGSLSANAFMKAYRSNDSLLWGYYDGTGNEIRLSISAYFDQFVYGHDYLNAEHHSVDSFIGSGNSLNNLLDVFPSLHFTEHYFSGFEPQYGGMDWGCLRLVYKSYENRLFLVGIINDQWTI